MKKKKEEKEKNRKNRRHQAQKEAPGLTSPPGNG
jgi:hypothetical protein